MFGTLKNSIPALVKPEPDYRYNSRDFDIDRSGLALLVGLIAIGMPSMILLASTAGLAEFRDTLSHYYYAKILGDIFVISLACVGTFLIAYKGESLRESWLATVTGGLCIAIAIFPTNESGMESGKPLSANARLFSDVTEISSDGIVAFGSKSNTVDFAFTHSQLSTGFHYASAVFVFAFLAYYSLFIFTRIRDGQPENPTLATNKGKRNLCYVLTGITILACMALIGMNGIFEPFGGLWDNWNITLFLESLMLVTFGMAWLLKAKPFGFWADG